MCGLKYKIKVHKWFIVLYYLKSDKRSTFISFQDVFYNSFLHRTFLNYLLIQTFLIGKSNINNKIYCLTIYKLCLRKIKKQLKGSQNTLVLLIILILKLP